MRSRQPLMHFGRSIAERPWLLLLIAFAVKLLQLLLLLVHHEIPLSGPWYFMGGDTTGYTEPIDSLLAGNGYLPDSRMPGYGAAYFLLRLVFSMDASMQVLVVLQVMASALTVVMLAKLGEHLTKDRRIFWCTYLIGLVATFTSVYDRMILTESFSAAALVLAVYMLFRRASAPGNTDILIAGVSMAWLIFMKPVFVPILGLLALVAFWRAGAPWNHAAVRAFLLLLPCLLAESAWIARNAKLYGVFRPLSDGVISPAIRDDVKFPVMQLIQAYGGSFIWWDPNADIMFFNVRNEVVNTADLKGRSVTPPAYALTVGCPIDSLERIAEDVQRYYQSSDPTHRAILLSRVTDQCAFCKEEFRRTRPFHYQVTSRLRMLRLFLIHLGSPELMARPFAQLALFGKGVKLFYTAMYLCIALPGALWGVFLLLRRKTDPATRVVALIVLYGCLIFPAALRMTESRYFSTFYPFTILLTVHLIVTLIDRSKRLGMVRSEA